MFREWIQRESDKPETPTYESTDFDREQAIQVLAETFGEPAHPAATGQSRWHVIPLSGAALDQPSTFPRSAWDRVSGDGTVTRGVDRITTDDSVASAFPGAMESIRELREVAITELGAAVARPITDAGEPVGT